MFLSKTLIAIPARTLIQDLALRSGSPTQESLSPYEGKYDVVAEMFRSSYDGSLSVLLASQPDYDADKQKPYRGKRTDEADENMNNEFKDCNPMSEDIPEYPRRLEDIDISHVTRYLHNVIYGARFNANNSVKAYARNTQTTLTLQDNEGEYIEEKDLLIDDTGDYSAYELQEAKNQLPYYIRRLHDKSKEIGIHLISLMRAYERAKDLVEIENLNRKHMISVRPQHLISEGVYFMGADGTIGALCPVDANKNSRAFQAAYAWLSSDSPTRRDANMLLNCFEMLGIDIRRESPLLYTKDYVDKLVVTYVTSNVDYLTRSSDNDKHSKYSSYGFVKSIYNQLKDLPLEAYEEYSKVSVMSEDDEAQTAMRIFIDTPNVPDSDKYRSENMVAQEQMKLYNACKMVIHYYNERNKTVINLDRYDCYDGFFFSRTGNPLILDLGYLMKGVSPNMPVYFLLNCNGYLVRCASGITTDYCDVLEVCDAMESRSLGYADAYPRWLQLSL